MRLVTSFPLVLLLSEISTVKGAFSIRGSADDKAAGYGVAGRDHDESTIPAGKFVEPTSIVTDNNTLKRQSIRELATADFAPLTCNNNLAAATCLSFSDTFGDDAVQTERVIIDCGTCITMDHPGPTLSLLDGIDIRGKLVFPNRYKLTMESTIIAVQGELEMTSVKQVNGKPDVVFVMTGEQDTFFEPHGSNSEACDGDLCKAGKKAIVVAGGKVTGKSLLA